MASFIKSDLEFILQQIMIAEANAAGQSLTELVPNAVVPFGLRTIDGTFNNLLMNQRQFGAADMLFPRTLTPVFTTAEPRPAGLFGPGSPAGTTVTSYQQTSGSVFDSQPRIISNPAAVQAYVDAGLGVLAPDGTLLDFDGVPIPAGQTLANPNTAPDVGLSAPFNA